MKKVHLITYSATFFLASFAFACTNSRNAAEGGGDTTSSANNTEISTGSQQAAHADIQNTKPDTTGSGTADFTQKDDGSVEMRLSVSFPKKANQTVAVHLHEHADCGNGGQEAHGHWNPTNEPHGKWGDNTFHSGDIGNIELDANGNGGITLSSDRWSLGGDEKTNILNRSIIVHSGVDDYKSQPSGNAGSRIGCGIIMASKQ